MTTALSAGIVTTDPERLVGFYRNAMGFELDSVSEFPQGTIHRLVCDQARLKLYHPAGDVFDPGRPDPWYRNTGFAYAALVVDDAAAVATRVATAGGRVHTSPTSHRPGAVFALVADPEGNMWEVLEEP